MALRQILAAAPPDLSTMWRDSAPVIDLNDYRLFYQLDTSEGHSGSPILSWDGQENAYFLVGVHTEGIVSVNGAVRVTDQVFDQFTAWRQENGDYEE